MLSGEFNSAEQMKQANAFIHKWAIESGYKIVSLFYFPYPFEGGYDFIINYE